MFKKLSKTVNTCLSINIHQIPTRNPISLSCISTIKISNPTIFLIRSFTTSKHLSDDEILKSLHNGSLSHHKLESITNNDTIRAIKLRRQYIQDLCHLNDISIPVDSIQGKTYYNQVNGANCEAVIGYIPVPVGIAGPLKLDGKAYYVPMATTEGALIASTNRGARAIFKSGGATTVLVQDGMTRAPAIECDSLVHAAEVKAWIEDPANSKLFKDAFASTTRFGRLESISVKLAGRTLYVRVRCFTGDAMGMNMIGKGSDMIVKAILQRYPTIKLKALSGNYCTDKKPAAVNWIDGRGKSVAAEAVIPKNIVKSVLKTTVDDIVEVNITKNLVGSAMAGSIGGNNAHAANMLTAVYLATGQDPAQNVESSNCITLMEKTPEGDLRVSVTMPCIEVGTVGGGTSLPAQRASLQLLGVAGAHATIPGANAKQLARIIVGTVLAGELSLMAALSVNHLVSAHMQLNRKPSDHTSTDNSKSTGHVSSLDTEDVIDMEEDMLGEDELQMQVEDRKLYTIDSYGRIQLVQKESLLETPFYREIDMLTDCPTGYATHRCPVP